MLETRKFNNLNTRKMHTLEHCEYSLTVEQLRLSACAIATEKRMQSMFFRYTFPLVTFKA
jgi:hypothetical protein